MTDREERERGRGREREREGGGGRERERGLVCQSMWVQIPLAYLLCTAVLQMI